MCDEFCHLFLKGKYITTGWVGELACMLPPSLVPRGVWDETSCHHQQFLTLKVGHASFSYMIIGSGLYMEIEWTCTAKG